MKRARVLALTIALLALSSYGFLAGWFSRSMDEADVPGVYQQKLSWAVETLILDPDGAFREEFHFNTTDVFASSGRWRMWKEPDGQVMVEVNSAVLQAPPIQGDELPRPLRLPYTFKAVESWRGRILERTPDPDHAVVLVRVQ